MSTATEPAANGQHQSPPGLPVDPPRGGLRFERAFAHLPEPEWTRRDVEIRGDDGKVIRERVEAPASWSDLALRVTASKYFFGKSGTPEREGSVKDLIERVAATIAIWGAEDGYFDSERSRDEFFADLTALLAHQHGAFNSPVWFNVGLSEVLGVEGRAENWRWDATAGAAVPCEDSYRWPQCSACFIQKVGDSIADIMRVNTAEAMLFKHGSGTGKDLSTLRSRRESLSGGGTPSGPVSFMEVYDATANIIRSGGKTRRAAKLETLKDHHPDLIEFIDCKPIEDRKAKALIAAGYSPGVNGEAYASVKFQNSNLSVRLTDEFLRRAEARDPATWVTRGVLGREYDTGLTPSAILDRIAAGAWECGDPCLQYEDTIQRWHTCPAAEPINSANPCIEYNFIDDSACNLASINFLKFRRADGSFDLPRFRAAVRVFVVAQEILVDRACYPTAEIAANSHRFRPLGLGGANPGAYLMASGLPYDSDEGRSLVGAITACLTGQAYLASAELAEHRGAFAGFAANREPMLAVVEEHERAAIEAAGTAYMAADERTALLWGDACDLWRKARQRGTLHGYRNAQVSCYAPTGTIGFLMDCDTFGIEPDFALVKHKSLVGGGSERIVNRSIRLGLANFLGGADLDSAVAWLEGHGTLEGFDAAVGGGYFDSHPDAERRLAVFDCANPDPGYGRSISWRGHLRMLAAVQPFISGATSKTCNLPAEATVEDIRAVYLEAWHLGLKAVAIYRDGSKGAQPLTAIKPESPVPVAEAAPAPVPVPAAAPTRVRLPDTRSSLTHKFSVDGHEGYIIAGLYPDGRPGEVFITIAKEGSTISGVMDTWATTLSTSLQYGVPLEVFVAKFAGARYEPSGFTPNPDIPMARSLTDYIARWLGMEFLPGYRAEHAPRRLAAEARDLDALATPAVRAAPHAGVILADNPTCPDCGCLTRRNGTCHLCDNCGTSLGCS